MTFQVTENEEFAIKNHWQGTSVENCRQPDQQVKDDLYERSICTREWEGNGKEFEGFHSVPVKFNIGFDYFQHMFKN